MAAFDRTATEPSPAVQFVPLVLFVIGFSASVGATFRRLNDLGMSRWWLLGMFAPLLNLALLLALFFVRSHPNAAALATSSAVPVVASVAIGLLLVGMIGAIASPWPHESAHLG